MSQPKTRRIITPEHFKLAPEVLGLPLATPMRRAVAMAIDGLLIFLLVKTGGVFLGIVAGALLFRASAPDPQIGLIRRSVRAGLRMTGAIILVIVVVKAWGTVSGRNDNEDEERNDAVEQTAADDDIDLDIAPRDVPALAGSIFTLRQARDSASVAGAATAVLETVKRGGADLAGLDETRGSIVGLMGKNADSSEVAAVNDAFRSVVGVPPPAPPTDDSLVNAYLAAAQRNDTAAVRAYRDTLKDVFAGEELTALRKEKNEAEKEKDALARDLEEARQARGIRSFIAGIADDLGVGFGWSAVYFTAFLALWRGQTPGKRVARVRVLRLDGKPLGWWISFERFGGYAASFSVGLLGFVQILWDRNRQGLHDKACETVVVIDSAHVRSRA